MEREEFLNILCPNAKSCVLMYEQSSPKYKKCSWFVHTKIWLSRSWAQDQEDFWSWVTKNCSGIVMCYVSSSEDGDWWGFQYKNDATLFKLSWS
jgi:hypothetical protein